MSLKKKIKSLLGIHNSRWYFSLKYSVCSLPFYLMRVFPIRKNKVVFSSFKGKYGGDPKYISDALHKKAPGLDLVWLVDDLQITEGDPVRVVRHGSLKEVFELATAKVWVDDCRKDGFVRKRKGQFYIGTGHGGIPMKKIEKDAEDKLDVGYLQLARNDSKMTDLKPSNSRWRNEMLRRAFWYDGEILDCGLPRVEHLLKNRKTVREAVRRRFGIGDEQKVFIYAPTFRNSEDTDVYNLDFARVKTALEHRFGTKWIGFRRLHPNVKNYQIIEQNDSMLDVTDYPDMEELLMASDLLITDYSSCIFETLFLNIPAIIYAVDIDDYTKKERGLYWDIAQLPFLQASDHDALVKGIETYDPDVYSEGLTHLREELGLFEDQTNATGILVDRILREMML